MQSACASVKIAQQNKTRCVQISTEGHVCTQLTVLGMSEATYTHTVNGGYVDPIKQLGLPKIQLQVSHHEVVRELI